MFSEAFMLLNHFLFFPQITKGYEFESETDTEVIPKLIKYVYDNRENDSVTFSMLVEKVIQQLVSCSHSKTQINFTPPFTGGYICFDSPAEVMEMFKDSFLRRAKVHVYTSNNTFNVE